MKNRVTHLSLAALTAATLALPVAAVAANASATAMKCSPTQGMQKCSAKQSSGAKCGAMGGVKHGSMMPAHKPAASGKCVPKCGAKSGTMK
ncbi:MAG: hypothetical protein EPN46_07735 [Candidimonas sp.]|nr:MAG: hypothetical protein EPN77_11800 [Candidimonas sp.]TAM24131.1 MAG: hypothetical protein EPN62_07810 [Candidimonas sp.]TAM76861.1 MAG: hypothetical protein EPN46_07735 [Candidimonas sp.]